MIWAGEELRRIDLGDKRLDKRTALLAERLASQPTASIPKACGGWGETQAAYRFFSNEGFDWLDLLEPHRTRTPARSRLVSAPRERAVLFQGNRESRSAYRA